MIAKTLRGDFPGRVVFHADRGAQYTSEQIHKVTKRLGVDQSMGRTGVCWDNAMAEAFWSTLKNEFYHRFTWPTRAEAKQGVAREKSPTPRKPYNTNKKPALPAVGREPSRRRGDSA